MNGIQRSYGDSFADALPLVPGIVLISFVTSIGIGLAMLLLIVPGLILLTVWAVAVPAYVNERPGVFESLSRSADLTRDHRLTIFGIFLVAGIGAFIIQFVINLPLRFVGGDSWLHDAIGQVVNITLTAGFWPVLGATIYQSLRDEKEGTGEDALQEIFT